MLEKNEKLAVAFSYFKAVKNAADKKLKKLYAEPVFNWVTRFKGHKVEIGDALKLYNTPILAEPEGTGLDTDRMATDLQKNLPQFSAVDLAKLIDSGVVGISVRDPEKLAEVLVGRGISPGYTVVVPAIAAGWTNELRDVVLNEGRLTGLVASSGLKTNLLELMDKVAAEITTPPQLKKVPQPGKVALTAKKK
jgi:hypothetical protein